MNAHHVHEFASILDAALYYATVLNFPVFPCKPDKSPFIAGGFKAASRETRRRSAHGGRNFPMP